MDREGADRTTFLTVSASGDGATSRRDRAFVDAAPGLAVAGRPTLVRWRILGLLAVVSFVSYLLRGNLSIAAPSMMSDLQLSEIQWGWVMSAFPLGYALFQFPGGVWGGRVGPRKALALIAVASSRRGAFFLAAYQTRTRSSGGR